MNQLSNRFLSVSLPALCFAVGLASMAACKDTVYVGGPAGDGGSTSADVGTGHSSRSGSGSGSGSDAGPVDSGAPAELCTRSGGTVVMTYCFANPPFAQYTCASGENGAICDPGPGETTPTTPECLCANGGASQCFDPAKGCVATGSGSGSDGGPGRGSDSSTGSDSGSDAGPTDAGATAALCTQSGGAVVMTYCSAKPPFEEYTCTTGDNGNGICDPGVREPRGLSRAG
jgi:hypothetical protein